MSTAVKIQKTTRPHVSAQMRLLHLRWEQLRHELKEEEEDTHPSQSLSAHYARALLQKMASVA